MSFALLPDEINVSIFSDIYCFDSPGCRRLATVSMDFKRMIAAVFRRYARLVSRSSPVLQALMTVRDPSGATPFTAWLDNEARARELVRLFWNDTPEVLTPFCAHLLEAVEEERPFVMEALIGLAVMPSVRRIIQALPVLSAAVYTVGRLGTLDTFMWTLEEDETAAGHIYDAVEGQAEAWEDWEYYDWRAQYEGRPVSIDYFLHYCDRWVNDGVDEWSSFFAGLVVAVVYGHAVAYEYEEYGDDCDHEYENMASGERPEVWMAVQNRVVVRPVGAPLRLMVLMVRCASWGLTRRAAISAKPPQPLSHADMAETATN